MPPNVVTDSLNINLNIDDFLSGQRLYRNEINVNVGTKDV